MGKTYRIIKSTYKGKDSFMAASVVGNESDIDSDCYISADSIPDLKIILEGMMAALERPVMVEKRELVEIHPANRYKATAH